MSKLDESYQVESLRRVLDVLVDGDAITEEALAATVGLYGLYIRAVSPFYQRLAIGDLAKQWRELMRVSIGVGAVLNELLDSLAGVLRISALKYHPDYRQYRDDSLINVVILLDRLDFRINSEADVAIVADVIYAFLGRRVRNQTAPGLQLTTLPFLNALGAQLLDEHRTSTFCTVYDPACGAGGSLVALYKQLKASGHNFLSVYIYGQDTSEQAIFIAAWNLLLCGAESIQLEVGDALIEPRFLNDGRLKQFNFVISQPPLYYSSDEDFGDRDSYQRFRYGSVQSSRADYAFIQHVLASLLSDGRAVVVVPASILSRSGFEEDIRAGLAHADVLETSVTFQGGVLLSKNTPAAVLVFNLNKPGWKKDKLFFMDAQMDKAYSLVDPPVPESAVINTLVERVWSQQEKIGVSKLVSIDLLKRRRYNLAPQAYVPRQQLTKVDLSALDYRIEVAEDEMRQARREFKRTISKMRSRPIKIQKKLE